MDVLDLIKMDGRKVRENSNLMSVYIETFFSIFGYKPNCAGCTFKNDFEKLKNAILIGKRPAQNNNIMETNKTFKLKKTNGTILTYRLNKRPFRMYDNRLTEDFAVAFLTNGSKEEITERKRLFDVLPESLRPKASPIKKEEVSETVDTQEEAKPVEAIEVIKTKEPIIKTVKTRKARKNKKQ
jgi:hypothetical protein